MKKDNMKDIQWEKDGFILRLSRKEDVLDYYKNFNPLDREVIKFTGCKENFSKEEVTTFFLKCIEDETRYDFLIISPNKEIIGESVVNEIDYNVKSANFRICIFNNKYRNNGLGLWAVEKARDFAFDVLKLHRLELDVYSFNKRAMKVYSLAGFKQEGIRRDAILSDGVYADDIIMSILENEWKLIKSVDK